MSHPDALLAWQRAAEETPAEERKRCPVCEYYLRRSPEGILHCPLGHWQSDTRRV